MALRIRTPGTNLSIEIERLDTNDGARLDFTGAVASGTTLDVSACTFTTGTPAAASYDLVAAATSGLSALTLTNLPAAVFPDGQYGVYVMQGGTCIRALGVVLVGGDDLVTAVVTSLSDPVLAAIARAVSVDAASADQGAAGSLGAVVKALTAMIEGPGFTAAALARAPGGIAPPPPPPATPTAAVDQATGGAVDPTTGGPATLAFTDPAIAGDGGVLVYLATDWAAGHRGGAFIRGQAAVAADGTWRSAVVLPTGRTYVFVYSKPGGTTFQARQLVL